ncbi:hypothetical protein [Streptomyces sp. NPDC048659]|uniref:hypothetical protein n=1 Tax=Streptomyces sp. NPDC048659 TaxID=3155489 RepID=UPI00341F883A
MDATKLLALLPEENMCDDERSLVFEELDAARTDAVALLTFTFLAEHRGLAA